MAGAILTLRDVCDGALAVALSQIGKHEEPRGSNSGPEVNQYLTSVGLSPGNAWCAAFAYYAYMRAAMILYTKNPCPKSGSVLAIWDRVDAHCKSMVPRRGSLYFIDHGHRRGHTGFVISVVDGKIEEVSGNTNQEGAREGDSVWRHSFRLTDPVVHGGKLLGFVDFAALVDNDTLVA
jgi:CHAP domain